MKNITLSKMERLSVETWNKSQCLINRSVYVYDAKKKL